MGGPPTKELQLSGVNPPPFAGCRPLGKGKAGAVYLGCCPHIPVPPSRPNLHGLIEPEMDERPRGGND